MTTVSKDTAAVLVALLLKHNVPLGMKEYKVMSELNGTKGAGGFDHFFRPIKQRAKEIAGKLEAGAVTTPVVKSRGKALPAESAAGNIKQAHKTAKATRKTPPVHKPGDDDGNPPGKKVKQERESTPEFSGTTFFEDALDQ